jgi:hypothetical protein
MSGLSTLATVRVLTIPQHRPPAIPVGEEPPQMPNPAPGYIQDTLAVDLDLVPDEVLFGPQPTRRRDLPDPEQWAAHLAQAIVEVMAGARPAAQILRWTTPEVYAVLSRRALVSTRRAGPATRRAAVRRVRFCEPADGVVEACAVVVDGGRVRALAMRLVGIDRRWRIEALQLG